MLRNKIASLIATVAAATILTACNGTSDIGTSIVQDQVEVVVDSTFVLSGSTVDISSIQSKTVAQLIGSIDAKGYGRLSSDVVTQFMPAATLDTAGVTVNDIDSLKLVMMLGVNDFIGDSIAPLGIEIYPLTKTLPSPIFSDFDPQGYYDPNQLLGSTIYNVSAISAAQTDNTTTVRTITVNLPLQLGRKLFAAYKENPANFAVPQQFIDNVFPGIYIKNSYGSGRVTRIGSSMMRMYYHRTFYSEETKRDSTVYKIGNYFAVTPEIVTNNNISLTIAPQIKAAAAAGEHILLAPAGMCVEVKFPILDIMASYRKVQGGLSVVNSLSMVIPAEEITNDYNIAPPTSLLMILKKDKETFFKNNNLPDNKKAFYAEYNTTTKTYIFSELRQYLLDMLAKGNEITPDDYTFTLIPVTANYEASGSNSYYYYNPSSVLSSIVPYVGKPTMAKLLLDKTKIKLTYSKQTITF